MRLTLCFAPLLALVCFAQPAPVAAASPTDVLPASAAPQPSTVLPPFTESDLLLGSRLLLAWGALFAGGALSWGVSHYVRQQRWQRIEFLRRSVKEFEEDVEICNALKILDFEEYRDYVIPAEGISFRVNDELLCRALANHDQRARVKQKLEYDQDHNDVDAELLRQYQIETALRDWFNKLLNGLEHFGYFLESGLFTEAELRPWLSYWIKLIADPAYRRPGASKFYDALYSYIHHSGFLGVQKLFERFDYRILPSPYRDTDLLAIAQNDPTCSPNQSSSDNGSHSPQMALTLAKAAYLAYQDKQFVAEIVGRWGTALTGRPKQDIIRCDFRYFNNRGRDTQAYMFRTDAFMVLAFRGSQEPQDWMTNLATQLRNFTLQEDGVTALSSYKGRVHTGFFLAWAIIEKSVLAQIRKWREEQTIAGKPALPLYVTGHSLGGALATMATAALVESEIDVAGLYTFGQPRVGDRTFVRQLSASTCGKVFRFVNHNDIVPHVPPPFSLWNPTRFYGHVGAASYFNGKGVLTAKANYTLGARLTDMALGLAQGITKRGFDHITDHRMEYYISHLEKALNEAVKDEATHMLGAREAKRAVKALGEKDPKKSDESLRLFG